MSDTRSEAQTLGIRRFDTPLLWLSAIFLLCIALVFGLRWFFNDLESELNRKGANERARLFVGEEIVRGIQGVEKDIYRMAITQNAKGFERIRGVVEGQIDKLTHDLGVLQTGGTVHRDMRLNVGGRDDVVREARYQPDLQSAAAVMEVIEIEPQLAQLKEYVKGLEEKLILRWNAQERGDRKQFFDVEEEIAFLLKQVPPQFERLDENANRLFLEGDQRLRSLELALQLQKERLKLIEGLLLAVVLILGATAGVLFMGRLSKALAAAKHAKDEVEQQRLQSDTMLGTLSDGVYATDMQGNITFINAAAEQLLGWRSEELVGRQAHDAIHHTRPDGQHYPRDACPLISVLSEGVSLDGEEHFVGRDNHCFPVSYRSKPLLLNGQVVGSLVSFQDISALQESESRIRLQRAALQEIGQGILIANADATQDGPSIEYVNPAFTEITGYSADEVLGQRTAMLGVPGQRTERIGQLYKDLMAGNGFTSELNYRRKDGTLYTAELHYSPVHNKDGKVTHCIGLLTDIGPRKEAERSLREARDQALENSRLKSEFLSNMSHEIRTPMNGIIGMTDLLLDTGLDPEQRDFTQVVRDSASALLTIINDILDFSKIEAGKLEIDATDFLLVPVVEGVVELLQAKASEKQLRLTGLVAPDVPRAVRCDPTRLRQILLNLIGNAIKFTDSGEVSLTLSQETVSDQPMILYEVKDSGIGMSQSTQNKLFQSFTQADSSTTRKYGGTGLGLAISKQLVELMGGQIGVVSAEGQGSTFWFRLPMVEALDRNVENASRPHTHRPALDASSLRVLVVDDHASERKILHRYLASWNLRNDGAASGEEALKLMKDAADIGDPYSLALIDYSMPTMDGFELAAAIRANSQLDGMRLVMMTAHDRDTLCARATRVGFVGCLAKPVRQSQLFDSLSDNPESLAHCVQPGAASSGFVATANPSNSTENRRLVLLAEDNLTNQKVAQLQINKLGYAVHIVANGQQAFDALTDTQGHRYAAVFMDCQMPVMDGFKATMAIRLAEQRTEALRIPIIAMTANAMQGDRERCIEVGMDDYISKPIAPTELSRTLMQWAGSPMREDLPDALTQIVTPQASLPMVESVVPPTKDIDFERLQEFLGDDTELIQSLFDLYVSSSVTLFEKLDGAIEARDAAAVVALSHETKGASANLGIDRMAEIASRMESACGLPDWALIALLRVDMEAAFVRLRNVLAERNAGKGS